MVHVKGVIKNNNKCVLHITEEKVTKLQWKLLQWNVIENKKDKSLSYMLVSISLSTFRYSNWIVLNDHV